MLHVAAQKLALGSAQFGSPYGVANRTGQTSTTEVEKILQVAFDHDIDTIDTAIAYGDSERILGTIGVNQFKVVTKLPVCNVKPAAVKDWVYKLLEESLTRLRIGSLYGLLLHNPRDLTSGPGKELADVLLDLRSTGRVEKIGVSIYDPLDLEVTTKGLPLDIVQAPSNLIDRRLERSGWLSRLKAQNIEVHTRSAFLQGLLLMPRHAIPPKFHRWSSLWDRWHENLKVLNVSPASACLSYSLSLPHTDRVVVGVESATQLSELIESVSFEPSNGDWSFMSQEDLELLEPSRWSGL